MYNLAQAFMDYALYLVFPAVVLAFLAPALLTKTYPTKRAAWFSLALAAVSCLAFLGAGEFLAPGVVLSFDACFVLVLLIDWATVAWRGRDVVVERRSERIVSLGQPLDVELIVENRSKRTLTFDLVDDNSNNSETTRDLSNDFLAEEETLNKGPANSSNAAQEFDDVTLEPNSLVKLGYRLVWKRRGLFALEFAALRFFSWARLWQKTIKIPCASTFQVFPNLCQLSQLKTLGRASRLCLLGVRQVRRVGQDADFERLRDYTQDDQFKFIDWKATARHNKLIVRDFQTARNQRIVLALDSGRMTMNYSNGATLFDSALNSSLALAYIALKQGDEVGLLIFSNDVRRFVPPKGGMSQMNALIRSVFDIFPERCESRYDRAFEYLAVHSPKRALVVLATNVLDERNALQVENALIHLSGSHLPLGFFLREHSLFDAVEQFEKIDKRAQNEENLEKDVDGGGKNQTRLGLWMERARENREPSDELERLLYSDSLLENASYATALRRAGVAADILNWRKKTLRKLEAKGALTLDVFPEDAVAPLVNKYLEIKARRLL